MCLIKYPSSASTVTWTWVFLPLQVRVFIAHDTWRERTSNISTLIGQLMAAPCWLIDIAVQRKIISSTVVVSMQFSSCSFSTALFVKTVVPGMNAWWNSLQNDLHHYNITQRKIHKIPPQVTINADTLMMQNLWPPLYDRESFFIDFQFKFPKNLFHFE